MDNLLDNFKLEAFDIFAYLLPGSIFLGALAIINWAFFYPCWFVIIPDGNKTWIIILALAYVFGHIAQGIGEYIVKFCENKCNGKKKDIIRCSLNNTLDCPLRNSLQNQLLNEVGRKIAKILSLKDLQDDDLYYICVAFIEQHGSTNSRKILQYRQGMFLGLAVSFFILSFISVILLLSKKSFVTFQFEEIIYQINFWYIAAISLIGLVVAIYRYKLFDRYRKRDALLSFLVISKNLKSSK